MCPFVKVGLLIGGELDRPDPARLLSAGLSHTILPSLTPTLALIAAPNIN